ncbi:Hypothetical protein PFR_JS8_1089 [Propionibacterium freudenreichii]|nr:Hypothetical protein PFR_JS8_1089 [Propionibacterium freudenreichii]
MVGRCARAHNGAMSEGNVIRVLARIYVDDLAGSLPLYEQLTGQSSPHTFTFGATRLARVGDFLLIEGADARVRSHAATIAVRDVAEVVAAVTKAGGQLLEGPAEGPNGPRLVARHPDGNVVEYVQVSEEG